MKLESTKTFVRDYGSAVFHYIGKYQSMGPWVGRIAKFTHEAAHDPSLVLDQIRESLPRRPAP